MQFYTIGLSSLYLLEGKVKGLEVRSLDWLRLLFLVSSAPIWNRVEEVFPLEIFPKGAFTHSSSWLYCYIWLDCSYIFVTTLLYINVTYRYIIWHRDSIVTPIVTPSIHHRHTIVTPALHHRDFVVTSSWLPRYIIVTPSLHSRDYIVTSSWLDNYIIVTTSLHDSYSIATWS